MSFIFGRAYSRQRNWLPLVCNRRSGLPTTNRVWDAATASVQQTIAVYGDITSLLILWTQCLLQTSAVLRQIELSFPLCPNLPKRPAVKATANHQALAGRGLYGTHRTYSGYHLTTRLLVPIFRYQGRQPLSAVNPGKCLLSDSHRPSYRLLDRYNSK